MKHVITGQWNFQSSPFDKFEAREVYGRNKRSWCFLPTKVKPNDEGTLPEGNFKIIKAKAKGTILIVPGVDSSKKVFLMASVSGGFRGGVSKIGATTNANILVDASAGSACESGYSFAAILEEGQQVDVHTYGRRTNNVIRFLNEDGEIKKVTMTKEEYQFVNSDDEEGEEL